MKRKRIITFILSLLMLLPIATSFQPALTMNATSPEESPLYDGLSVDEKNEIAYEKIIKEITDAVVAGTEKISVDISFANINCEDTWSLMNAIRKRAPWMVFQFDERQMSWIQNDSNTSTKFLNINLGKYTPTTKALVSERIEKELLSYLDCIEPTMSDIEIITAIYDRYISKVCYTEDGSSLGTFTMVQGALLSQSAKCYEYDIIIATLLNMLGFDATTTPDMFKKAQSGVGHAWTMLSLDSHWYVIDGTWDGRNFQYGKIHHKNFISRSSDIARAHVDYWDYDSAIEYYKLDKSTKYDNMLVYNTNYYYHYYNGYWYYLKGNKVYRSLWSDDTTKNSVTEQLVLELPYEQSAVWDKSFPLSHAFNRDRLYYYNFDTKNIESINIGTKSDKKIHTHIDNGIPLAINVYEKEFLYKFEKNGENHYVTLDSDCQTKYTDRNFDFYNKRMLKALLSIANMKYDYYGHDNQEKGFTKQESDEFLNVINSAYDVYNNENASQDEITNCYKALQKAYDKYSVSQNNNVQSSELQINDNAGSLDYRGRIYQISALNGQIATGLEAQVFFNDNGKLQKCSPVLSVDYINDGKTYVQLPLNNYLNKVGKYSIKYRIVGDGVLYTPSRWQYFDVLIGSKDNLAQNVNDYEVYNDWLNDRIAIQNSDNVWHYGFRSSVKGISDLTFEKENGSTYISFVKPDLTEEFELLNPNNLVWTALYPQGFGDGKNYYQKLIQTKDNMKYLIKVYVNGVADSLFITDETKINVDDYLNNSQNVSFGVTVIPPYLFTISNPYDSTTPTIDKTMFLNSDETLISNERIQEAPQNVTLNMFKVEWQGNSSSTYNIKLYKNSEKILETTTSGNVYNFENELTDIGLYHVEIFAIANDNYLESTVSQSNQLKIQKHIEKPIISMPTSDNIFKNIIVLPKLESIDGYVAKYSKDGILWQESNEFSGLSSGTNYVFYAKYFGISDLYVDSEISDALSVNTLLEDDTEKDFVNVDISWGEMTFTYHVEKKTWNPETHKVDIQKGTWEATSNKISITNHSNVKIIGQLSYEPNSTYENVIGAFYNDKDGTSEFTYFSLDPADKSQTPDSSFAYFIIQNGKVDESIGDGTRIGTITFTIAQQPKD